MFMQVAATMFLLVAYVLALDVSDIPPQYRALLPSDLKHFLENLSPEEQAALMESFKENTLPIEERLFVATIKKKSPRLGETIENVLANWRARIAALQPEAQEFANLVWNNGVKLVTQLAAGSKPSSEQLQMVVSTILSRYNSLSSFAKADFRYQFPILSSALTVIVSYRKYTGRVEGSGEESVQIYVNGRNLLNILDMDYDNDVHFIHWSVPCL